MREARKPKKDTSLLDELEEIRAEMKPFWDERRVVEERECPARREKLDALHVNIISEGGNCPVQIEGHVKGKPFYFRARGGHWSLGIGRHPITDPEWYYDEPYGTWPDAGWMRLHEAYDFLIAGILRWRPKLAKAIEARQGGDGTAPSQDESAARQGLPKTTLDKGDLPAGGER